MMKFLIAIFLLALAASASAGVCKIIEEIEDRVNNGDKEDHLVFAGINANLQESQDTVYETSKESKDHITNYNNVDDAALAAVNEILEKSQDRITDGNNANISPSDVVYETNQESQDRITNANNMDDTKLAGVNEAINNFYNVDASTSAGVNETREENEDPNTNYYYADAMASSGVNETHETIDGRITNGNTAYAGQLPYQVGLRIQNYKGSIWCGGSLIGSRWVLTAAHCTIDVVSVTVYLGSIQRYYGTTRTATRQNIINHQGFNRYYLTNDISLIQIPAVNLNSPYIQTIKLPAISNYYSSYAGENIIASGWGGTKTNYYGSKYLQWARLQVIANSACAATFGSIITSGIICASTFGGISTCFGDSGGPMVLENLKIQIGVTSFLYSSSCQSGHPAAFTRITSYLDWIRYYTGIYYT